jgi:alcohol dehydrogenase (cytochrome c)
MGLSLHGDMVLVPTSDLHVVALNARSGELVWDHEIRSDAPTQGRGQLQLRSAPLVVGEKVIQGVTSSFTPGGGFIVALDMKSGRELWRFNTISAAEGRSGTKVPTIRN